MILAPSILSLDYSNFEKSVEILNENVDWLHFDVMDGHFVPNLTFGPDILKAFRKMSPLFLDVHLMVDDPFYYADVFSNSGADGITFHYESLYDTDKAKELIKKIKNKYISAGVSIKPNTSVESIIPLLKIVDLVLVMSVEPGFGGQEFIDTTYQKIKFLSDYKMDNGLNYLIEVDGGVNDKNARKLYNEGTNVLVAGSYIFNGDIKQNIDKLQYSFK